MMTALLGFLLLLFVGNSYQQDTGLLRDAAGQIIPDALQGVYTKAPIVNGVKDLRYRNFTNLLLDRYFSFMWRSKVSDLQTCDDMCQQTKNCHKFQLVTGIDFHKGCTLFTSCPEAIITPMYSGDATCDEKAEGCIKRDLSYSKEHRIQILREKLSKYPLKARGLAACKERCETFSGQNGVLIEDIDWKRVDNKTIKGAASNGKVPCAYFTYYRQSFNVKTCMMFAKGAKETKVEKIAGPTPKSEEERLKNLKNAIDSQDFHDFKGAVYSKDHLLKHEESIIYPKQCKEACDQNKDCYNFQSVIGMPHKSGCYMFKRGAILQKMYITTGMGNCSASDCRTDDHTFGHTYEIVPKPQYGFTGSSLEDCQTFCSNHHSDKRGFRWHELHLGETGEALEYFKPLYRCSYFTFISRPLLGKQCILFAGEPKRQNIILRGLRSKSG